MAKIFGAQGKPVSTTGALPAHPAGSTSISRTPLVPTAPNSLETLEPGGSKDPADINAGTLVVGRQIVLSGEVTACNRLIVEGTIKANIKECRDIAIAAGGLFTGSAAVQSAEISGRFEGELKVSGRLLIRAPGLVSGTVQYGEIEIERGGRIAGNLSAEGQRKTF